MKHFQQFRSRDTTGNENYQANTFFPIVKIARHLRSK